MDEVYAIIHDRFEFLVNIIETSRAQSEKQKSTIREQKGQIENLSQIVEDITKKYDECEKRPVRIQKVKEQPQLTEPTTYHNKNIKVESPTNEKLLKKAKTENKRLEQRNSDLQKQLENSNLHLQEKSQLVFELEKQITQLIRDKSHNNDDVNTVNSKEPQVTREQYEEAYKFIISLKNDNDLLKEENQLLKEEYGKLKEYAHMLSQLQQDYITLISTIQNQQ
jgi:chromosome segregation ATPase